MEKSQGKEGDRLTHGSLFSGIGGFELGAALAGIDTLWSCEITAHLDKNGVRVVTWKGADGFRHIAKQSNNCNKLQNNSL